MSTIDKRMDSSDCHRPLNLSTKKEVPVYLTQQGRLEYPSANMSNATDVNNNVLEEGKTELSQDRNKSIDQDNDNSNQESRNANLSGKMRSFACVSCSFISSSVESLGSHFIESHFLDSGATDNNNNIHDTPVIDYDHKKFRKPAIPPGCYNVCETQTSYDGDKTFGDTIDNNNNRYSSKKIKPMKTKLGKSNEKWSSLVRKESTPNYHQETDCLDLSAKSDHTAESDVQCESIKEKDPLLGSMKTPGNAEDDKKDKSGLGVKLSGDIDRDVEGRCGGTSSSAAIDVELLSCLVCARSYPMKAGLMKHLNKIHRLSHLCQLCYFNEGVIVRFANPVSLRNHKMRAHPADMVRCECGAMLCDDKLLLAHQKKFKCHLNVSGNAQHEMVRCICGKRFETYLQLHAHKAKCRKRYSQAEPRDELDNNWKSSPLEPASLTSTSGYLSERNGEKSEKYFKPDNSTGDTKSDKDKIIQDENNNLTVPNFCSVNNELPMNYTSKTKRKTDKFHRLSEDVISPGHDDSVESKKDHSVKKLPYQMSSTSTSQSCSLDPTKSDQCSSAKTNPSSLYSSVKPTEAKNTKTGSKRKAGSEIKYPCKYCGQGFKRPYLYVHQKTVHQSRGWVLIQPKKSTATGVAAQNPFSCGWCPFYAKDMKAVVYHHYSTHQELELDVKTNI